MGLCISAEAVTASQNEGIVSVAGSKWASASYLGMVPEGWWDDAGAGALVLTRTNLYFTGIDAPVDAKGKRVRRRIPLSEITSVTTEKSFKRRGVYPSLVVSFASSVIDGTGPGGSVTMGFAVSPTTGGTRAFESALRAAALQAHNDKTDVAHLKTLANGGGSSPEGGAMGAHSRSSSVGGGLDKGGVGMDNPLRMSNGIAIGAYGGTTLGSVGGR